MKVTYDKYYKTENLFGNPYPELIDFFRKFPNRGKVLDLGCGQGRDAIPLARLGFEVLAIDNSSVGIAQMNKIAKAEDLPLKGEVSDIYKFDDFNKYNFVLLDSMFHFLKKDRKRETEFIKRIISKIQSGCQVVICIQDSGKKVEILNALIDEIGMLERVHTQNFEYLFEDSEIGHKSATDYQMIVVKK